MSSRDTFSTHTHEHNLPNKHTNYYRGQIICFSGLSMGGYYEKKKNTDKITKEPVMIRHYKKA